MTRVLHLSDVHVDVPLTQMPWRQMVNKRFLGAANLVLSRHSHFAQARQKLASLAQFAREHAVDAIICTGDYTALGTEPEIIAARQAIEPLTRAAASYVTLPGNHDLYMPDCVADTRFERHFGDLLRSDAPELCTDGLWPIVRFIGSDVAVIAVNSARPNPQPWRSSGRIPDAQVEALARIVRDPRMAQRFVFVATHYAPRRADGTPDRKSHGLDNAEAFLHACAGVTRGALLHGHIHWRFQLQVPELRVRIFGAGSTTCAGREGLWLFDIEAGQARATPGSWLGERYGLDSGATVTF
ncbi:MAG TPA: metallophosphoesterase [Polyangiales bacterium]